MIRVIKSINSNSSLRIGPIPTMNKLSLIITRELDHRGHLGLDPVFN